MRPPVAATALSRLGSTGRTDRLTHVRARILGLWKHIAARKDSERGQKLLIAVKVWTEYHRTAPRGSGAVQALDCTASTSNARNAGFEVGGTDH